MVETKSTPDNGIDLTFAISLAHHHGLIYLPKFQQRNIAQSLMREGLFYHKKCGRHEKIIEVH